MGKRQLRIAHLYPKMLNIYGDYGNVLTLRRRCEWRDISVTIDEIEIGDSMSEHDIYFMGGGQDIQQIAVSKELQLNKEFFKEEQSKNAVFLAICGGYQLLGHYYQPADADRLDGISLLDAYTVAGNTRFIGNYLHGSFLPKNPHFADYLIKLALQKRYGVEMELESLEDTLEYYAHASVVEKSY